jgi:hypothetical protein
VKEIFPPRDRARWLLITMRLSARSLAGTARTLVAVGTVSDRFMFLTTAAAAPRSGDCDPAATGVLAAGLSAAFGCAALSWAGAAAGAAGLAGAGAAAAGAGVLAGLAAGAPSDGAGFAGAACSSRSPPGLPGRKSAKNSCQAWSTLAGSARYCWYISSTSHSLVPNPFTEEVDAEEVWDELTLDTGSSAFFVCGRLSSVCCRLVLSSSRPRRGRRRVVRTCGHGWTGCRVYAGCAAYRVYWC